MTNAQAQAYAVMALHDMIKNGEISTKGKSIDEACHKLNRQMHWIFDQYTEKQAESIGDKILEGDY